MPQRSASRAPVEWGIRQVPDQPLGSRGQFRARSADGQTVDRKIPPWTEAAWNTLSTNRKVDEAVAIFYEGLKVEPTNPSLAFVCFIASVEVVSQMLFHDQGSNRSIAAKFRRTLRLVLPEERASELGAAYSSRSRTVHAGRLHGFEPMIGVFPMRLWSPDKQHDFVWQHLRQMREAAQALLNLALRDELPERQHFVLD